MKRTLNICIISDVHLGTYGCHAKELLNYLKSIKPKVLILNGDFFDIWQFNKKWFPSEHVKVVQRIMKMAMGDTKVYYITGNHDDALRRYSGFSIGNIYLRDSLLIQINGEQHWIFHGDVFDLVVQYSPLLSKLGGHGYDWLIRLNRFVNKWRTALGKPRMSFAANVKQRVKEAVKFVADFEDTAIRLAREKGYGFVICGHIHQPQIRQKNGVTYLNSGDWVESLTALEFNFGKWSIYEYDEADFEVTNPRLKVKEALHDPDDEKVMDEEAMLLDILGAVNG
ncbi:MAG: UDP-2,3-diacylglucosamine diphosphatase [Saprospiraceae bacterium]|nr:UDP-2,3-diacylglucosamine diphosphatase [Saprospiraceae bacterium]MCF8250529.1 UDP-2,3-diacylglucosamine diphosphatase [Saprospiraceae bacterium]MCF8279669.1 UDP-2,3-diacylglucosamine diphosphatase [Bacteroidales bacterium]MCF8312455.1 UDP-2,3-diacylglucosamine diphosphatase [Saprospiraceae bacterium]MCF8440728.1 UDP-2,3-diacylglucosamine diphosphatase [Saprospiraceae bacterium]